MKYLFHVDVELIRRTDAINLIKMREKWSINIVSQYPVSDLGIFPAIRGLIELTHFLELYEFANGLVMDLQASYLLRR
ncbi:hypothetical protein QE152_g15816 [Popillia japonica]|uniref:Uncharacterized protein n=1 Tax=Popillia japonica TaxID=7064 RepID=A0AAW1L7H5_POPJA